MLNLFIPTTPNPTTGWYAVVAERDVVDLAMSIEDAFKVVVSGGIVNPGNLVVAALSQNLSPIVESVVDPEIDSSVASVLSTPIIEREDNL